jgi:Gas vesicle protein
MEGSYLPSGRTAGLPGRPTESTNLADILERVLDKGIVIAGDIQINLLDIELLTIKLRLLIASVDRAREMGINWWETDPALQAMDRDEDGDRDQLERENRELRERLERLEQRIGLERGSEQREEGEQGQEREGRPTPGQTQDREGPPTPGQAQDRERPPTPGQAQDGEESSRGA